MDIRASVLGTSLLHRVFTAHLPGGEWPDEFTVDVIGRERSAFSMRKPVPAKPLRIWPSLIVDDDGRRVPAQAVNVPNEKGVDVLMVTRPRVVAPLGKRLSYAAARVDEAAEKPLRGKALRRVLRPMLHAVAALTAKVEKADVIEARRKRSLAKAAA